MRAQPQPKEFNGEPVRRQARRARMSLDGLYRYVSVPPAYYDRTAALVALRLRAGRYREVAVDAAGRCRAGCWGWTCTSAPPSCGSANR